VPNKLCEDSALRNAVKLVVRCKNHWCLSRGDSGLFVLVSNSISISGYSALPTNVKAVSYYTAAVVISFASQYCFKTQIGTIFSWTNANKFYQNRFSYFEFGFKNL
jgi:hypothetical protein